jgi:hypothetical protein
MCSKAFQVSETTCQWSVNVDQDAHAACRVAEGGPSLPAASGRKGRLAAAPVSCRSPGAAHISCGVIKSNDAKRQRIHSRLRLAFRLGRVPASCHPAEFPVSASSVHPIGQGTVSAMTGFEGTPTPESRLAVLILKSGRSCSGDARRHSMHAVRPQFDPPRRKCSAGGWCRL